MRRVRAVWQGLGLAELNRRGRELELLHRAMGFATLALVTLAPLLIVVAAADPLGHGGFALWLVDGMDLSGRSARALTDVFTPPRKVIGTTSALSVALLALFGLSFASSVQNGYEHVWRPTDAPWHRIWRRQLVWLVMLMGYLYAQVQTRNVLAGTPRILLSMAAGLLFFWWGPHFLLNRQVPWRYLLPGALATMAGLVGLRWFSYLVFTPLLVTNAVSYGPVGTVLVVESWLVGVGFVLYGGALLGRLLCERFGDPGAAFRTEPGAPEAAQDPVTEAEQEEPPTRSEQDKV
ncbi:MULTISPECIES: ribonuclease BN [unclassified Streptomyces]|uniref:ribonuclease BN n=1 Tax=unclassified Streptomyces TaxID=2593676 RepID=UPI002E2BD334|nr:MULTISPECIES: ribonuclease BN [unclassified Streptomyces]